MPVKNIAIADLVQGPIMHNRARLDSAGDRADALRFAVRLAQRQRGLTEDEAVATIMRRSEECQ
jgi:hypothetical protein